MITRLRARYQRELELVNAIMSAEVTRWQWADLPEAERIIRDQLARQGKQLRPLLALAVADVLGAGLDRVCAPAASVEFYHLAALVLDDVQDNSAVRRGAPAVHTTATTSMAINIAMTIRSLAYHPLHRSELLTTEEKLGLHRELDDAATELVLGQTIDIGWHLGWYNSHAQYPYDQMIQWKTGAMFGCAAAMGAQVAGAGTSVVDAARQLGLSLGVLYQLADDYLDVFGEDRYLHRPRYEDFRGRKMSAPVLTLLRTLVAAGCRDDAERVAAAFGAGVPPQTWDWLVRLMDEHGIGELLRQELAALAKSLGDQVSELSAGLEPAGPGPAGPGSAGPGSAGPGSAGPEPTGLRMLLELIMTPLQPSSP